jgi:hypothetical protein
MSINSRLIAAVFALSLVTHESMANAQSAFVATRVAMRVARHANVAPFNLTEHDACFGEASAAFQGDSGTNDIAFNLTLQRLDTVDWIFSAGSDNITSKSQLDAVFNNGTKSWVNIVNQINYCGGVGAFAGCGRLKVGFVVVRSAVLSNVGGVTYAHEFGHTRGVPHSSAGLQIMDPLPLTPANNKVFSVNHVITFGDPISYNCAAGTAGARRLCVLEWESVFYPPTLQTLNALTSQAPPLPSIEELAQSTFVQRLPVWAEDVYDQSDVEFLKWMLQDPQYADFEREIVTLIGLISDGSIDDIEALEDYAVSGGFELEATMIALGSIVARHRGNAEAMAVLEDFFSVGYTVEAGLGLTVSGTSEGHRLLTAQGRNSRLSAEQRAHFSDAAEGNRRVARLGFRGYYASP